MKNKTKKIIGIILFIIILFIALPNIFNTKAIVPLKTPNINLNSNSGSYYPSYENICEKDNCLKRQCIDSKDLPEDIINYKICVCCVNFEFKEDKNTKNKSWTIKDYKIEISYQEMEKEQKKISVISNPYEKILLPTFKNKYLSITPDYSEPYYFESKYPEELQLNLYRVKINWRGLLEFITSQK